MAKRSRLPETEDLSRSMILFFEQLDLQVAAQTNLSTGATLAQTVTAVNSLLAAMRTAGKMEKS